MPDETVLRAKARLITTNTTSSRSGLYTALQIPVPYDPERTLEQHSDAELQRPPHLRERNFR